MDRRYRNTFDQIHMSAACQARILEAASSACKQEDQTAMKKPKNVLKTMLLAAALAGCLSAVAYASSNMLPAQLDQLSNVVLTSDGRTGDNVEKRQKADGSTTYILERDGAEAEINVNEPELADYNLKVAVEEYNAADGQANLEIVISDTKTANLEPESPASETLIEKSK